MTNTKNPTVAEAQAANASLERSLNRADARARLERLIGTDETKGVRGDLARARATQAHADRVWAAGTVDAADYRAVCAEIAAEITRLEGALATFTERLAALAAVPS